MFIFALLMFAAIHAAAYQPWVSCSSGMPDTVHVFSLAKSGSVLYAGTGRTGVFRSSDNGDSWGAMPTHPRLMNAETWGLAVIDTFIFAGQRGGGVLRIGINEAAWTDVSSGLASKIVQELHVAGKTLYVATMFGGAFKSEDFGNSWQEVFGGAGIDDKIVYSLASNSTTLFAGTAGVNTTMPDTGVCFRAPLTGGSTWERINSGFVRNGAHLEAVSGLAASDDYVFAGTDDVGIFRSTDNGSNWKQVHVSGDVHAITISGNAIYYGTSWAGVFTSTDGGLTWLANYDGIRRGNSTMPDLVKDFLVVGKTIFTATNLGVFRQQLPEAPGGIENDANRDFSIRVFPQPTSDEITLEITLKTAATFNATFFDATGRVIMQTEEMPQTAGSHFLKFDASAFTTGVYSCVIHSGAMSDFIRFTIVQ